MIFAKIHYDGSYNTIHARMLSFLKSRFDHVEGGLQSDSWIWVHIDGAKVAVDTFSAMTHEVKSTVPGSHVNLVLNALQDKYSVEVYSEPEKEAHED